MKSEDSVTFAYFCTSQKKAPEYPESLYPHCRALISRDTTVSNTFIKVIQFL